MIWHSSSAADTAAELGTSIELGLSSDEVQLRLFRYGKNQFTEKRKKSFFNRFIAQMKNAMVIILIIAAGISILFNFISPNEKTGWLEPVIIVGIVLLNALLGVIQESRAEAALESLKNLAAPVAKVIRDGEMMEIDATQLVPGDLIVLETGDYIPADARICSSYSLRSDESMLTGESVSSEKEADDICVDIAGIGDRHNMVYCGCSVSYGRGRAIVTETGMNTEMGKIATILKTTEDAVTPLQTRLSDLGKKLGVIALSICAILFIISVIIIRHHDVLEMLMVSVSLAVAAIPEGLPAIVVIVLALGVQRMVKKNAIIRRLPAVETLGSASVICSDKTGTLTQNRMTLVKTYTNNEFFDIGGIPAKEVFSMLQLSALCCDGDVSFENDREKHIGDPTETGILAAAYRLLKTDKITLESSFPRMAEIPFDSERKLMSTVNMIEGKPVVIVKGAPDILISKCKNKNNEALLEANHEMASEALRVIGVAIKYLDEAPPNPNSDELECNLDFVGLLGLIDPPRPEAKIAIEECKSAGIRTVMITGDHIVTATAIAKQLSILNVDEEAVTGEQLSLMDDDELFERIEFISVYARVSPEDKIRIVRAWQKKGQIVAMTGDGVNDAPALKAADIGCAMGITGTDVAKGAAAMTLTDDNFATIVTAVKEGRGIYNNIKKAVHFLLSCNAGEIIAIFAGMLIFGVPILSPIMLLWMNFVTDGLPALALGMEPVEKNIMKHQPRRKNEGIFAGGMAFDILWQGLMFGIITITGFYLGASARGYNWGMALSDEMKIYGMTIAFATLSISQLFHAFNCRSQNSILKVGLLKNIFMLIAFITSISLMLGVMLITPLRNAFELGVLDTVLIEEILLLSFIPVVLSEIVKLIRYILLKIKK